MCVCAGVQSVSTSVQHAVTLSAGELPVEEILIQQVIESGERNGRTDQWMSFTQFWSPGICADQYDTFTPLSFCFYLAGGAKKCIKVGGEFYSSSTLEKAVSGRMTLTGQSQSHQQGETHTRVMEVRDDVCVFNL